MSSQDASGEGLLSIRHRPPVVSAVVLMLHGGRAEGRQVARPWHLAALRMRPFVRAVAAQVNREDVLLAQVRYRRRGWNGDQADPLRDARRALDRLRELVGDVPVVLLGHSMGGRAALRAAGAEQVRGVVALAPWCPPGEPVSHLKGKDVLVLHGDRDRVTDPDGSAVCVRRARAAGARAGMLLIEGGDHAMLRHHGYWHRTAASAVAHLVAPDTARFDRFADATGAGEPVVVRSPLPSWT
ncbi:alpha/beta fold hydrolase [Streptomyces sp. NPDC002309]